MPSDPIVRSIERRDHGQWLPLWDGYNAFYGRSGATALAAEVTAMTWSRFFDAYEPVHALVAESEAGCSASRTISFIAAPRRSRRSATCRTCSRAPPRAARASAAP